MNIIYEPAGRAKEYCELAVNLYRGCGHGCVYCYSPSTTRTERSEFYGNPEPRKDIIAQLEKDCGRESGDGRKVLLSFTSDPYQPVNDRHGLTRQAIVLLKRVGYNVVILTKGGRRAEQDFDLLTGTDYAGATLTFLNDADSLEWEPGAALPGERLAMLREAKRQGIGTWVSLEPVIDPEQALEIIRRTHEYVDLYKVGTLNYHQRAAEIDWRKFVAEAVAVLREFDCKYYIKQDLRKYLVKTA